MKHIPFLLIICLFCGIIFGQAVPSDDENIPFLMTFGRQADKTWGDDDFSQTFFFIVPETYNGLVFIRIFDADTGGAHDEQNGQWDTRMHYMLYGGTHAYSHKDVHELDPVGNYKSGNLLTSKIIGEDPKWDNNWLTFGPFNPTEGEYVADYKGYIFKLICDGISGDDGNLYRYFLSSSGNENIAIEGGNAFTFEYSFRLHDSPTEISHIYPFVDTKTISIKQTNFDWDDDGVIRVSSEVRREQLCEASGDSARSHSIFGIMEGEKGKSLNFEFIKKKSPAVKNNNVVISIQNQYGESMPFFSTPIGGVPRFKVDIIGTNAKKPKK